MEEASDRRMTTLVSQVEVRQMVPDACWCLQEWKCEILRL